MTFETAPRSEIGAEALELCFDALEGACLSQRKRLSDARGERCTYADRRDEHGVKKLAKQRAPPSC